MTTFARKLKKGDGVRIIAPSCAMPSMPWLTEEFLERAKDYLRGLGLTVSEGKYLREMGPLEIASIEHRVEDIHDAFLDPTVHMLICIRGGWNGNQLLRHLNYDLIKNHPKIFCGFSDISIFQNAIYAKTGLVTYSGPNFSQFVFSDQFPYTREHFEACFMKDEPLKIVASKEWSNDKFSNENPKMKMEKNDGWWMLQEGSAEGTLLGGNLCTVNLLQGTEYMPDIRGSVLFLEDDYESPARTFDRNLQSLLHMPEAKEIRGLVIGRFEKTSEVSRELLAHMIATKSELKGVPVVANVDFGHTHPAITFPIGGSVRMSAGKNSSIEITSH